LSGVLRPPLAGGHQDVGRLEAGRDRVEGTWPTRRTWGDTPSSSAWAWSSAIWSGRPPTSTNRAPGWLRATLTMASSRRGTPW
jgi:hypothetical protein